jgi:hypothetical protein
MSSEVVDSKSDTEVKSASGCVLRIIRWKKSVRQYVVSEKRFSDSML